MDTIGVIFWANEIWLKWHFLVCKSKVEGEVVSSGSTLCLCKLLMKNTCTFSYLIGLAVRKCYRSLISPNLISFLCYGFLMNLVLSPL